MALLFLKLGLTAFGGPAAHIAMMRDEVVRRRKWMSDAEFLDLVGATNLIPGPNSTEMAVHVGYLRAGWPGLITAGLCFVAPAVILVLGLAWGYVRFGATVQAEWPLVGIKPVVIAIVVHALWGLGRRAVRGWLTALVGLGVLVLAFAGVNEIVLLFGGALLVMLATAGRRLGKMAMGLSLLSPGALLGNLAAPFSYPVLFLTFLKIGSVMYGSGYVLLAFLRADFVTRLGWLTDRQLVDAIAVGQLTPGPLFSSATFIGYLLGGTGGALLATLGIFLPSFVFVALSNPLIPRIRHSPWAAGFLDGANVASLGLMAAVTWELGRASLVDPFTIVLALGALGVLWTGRVSSVWLILAGALAGVVRGLVA